MEEILRVYVELEDSIQVKGQTCNVNMIRFSGYAKSKYFQGKILPGGVDLQKCKIGEKNHLSARYILEGKDMEGNECRIFIENNGVSDENGVVKTTPVIITDSKALSWMESAGLEGSISSENNMVIIHIHKCM